MPAWGNGTPEGERDSWGLVHFIRRLAKLTPEDIERMEGLNPKTSDAVQAKRKKPAGSWQVRTPSRRRPAPHKHDDKD